MPVPDDYLAAGGEIIERLRQQVLELRAVLPMEEIADAAEGAVQSPLAYVAYYGDVLGDAIVRGAPQIVTQRWLTVIAVRGAQRKADAHSAAGPLLSAVIAALAGWKPEALRRPLRRLSSPAVSYIKGGLTLYPLLWGGDIATT